jgi:predicted Zn finger-like uncharacterized protein
MLIATACPNCKALFRLPENMAGQKVKCQKCQHIFVVPKAEDNAVAPAASVAKPPIDMELDPKPAPEPIPAPVATAVVAPPPALPDEETDDEPARPSKPPPIGKRRDDDRPTTRRERPAPAASGSSAGMIVLILLLLGGALFGCVGCVGGLGWWAYAVNDKPLAKGDKKDKGKIDDKGPGKEIKVDEDPPVKKPLTTTVVLGANGTFRSDGFMNGFDPKKVYTMQMKAGEWYQFDMMSRELDSYLIIYNDLNQEVARDDDSGGNLNARIMYRADRTGLHRIHATQWGGGRDGNYTLFVRRTNGQFVPPPPN